MLNFCHLNPNTRTLLHYIYSKSLYEGNAFYIRIYRLLRSQEQIQPSDRAQSKHEVTEECWKTNQARTDRKKKDELRSKSERKWSKVLKRFRSVITWGKGVKFMEYYKSPYNLELFFQKSKHTFRLSLTFKNCCCNNAWYY